MIATAQSSGLLAGGERGGPPPARKPVPASRPRVRPAGRILVVEDDYFVGLSSEIALLDAGFDVLSVVVTGEEAVRVGTEKRPDLVLMDIRLAGKLDGIGAALALREHGIACLFATAHSDERTRARAEKAKPLGWIVKPFSTHALVAAVEAALRRASNRGA